MLSDSAGIGAHPSLTALNIPAAMIPSFNPNFILKKIKNNISSIPQKHLSECVFHHLIFPSNPLS
jgi:hypothetical protein